MPEGDLNDDDRTEPGRRPMSFDNEVSLEVS